MKRFWNIVMVVLLAVPLVLRAQTSHADLSVAERNAQMGFNDTIDRLADDFVTVSLVVCDPSEVLYSTLGHAALHLQCPIFNLDYIFTYESESVRDKIWTFLRGDLKMGMFALHPEDFLADYRDSGRGVKEYKINLNPEQKISLWRVMDNHALEGANLPYDYFHRGCAKSVILVIHEALGKDAIHYAPWSDKYQKQTQRELVRNYIEKAPWEEFFMYFLIGVEGDKEYPCEQKLIIPTDLVEVWQQATFDDGRPVLNSKCNTLLEATKHNQGTWCTPLLVCVFLLLLVLASLVTRWTKIKRIRDIGVVVDYCALVIFAIAGVVMTYLIIFSELPCTDWNWLIIPFNILPVVFWHWRKYWALPYAILIFGWCLVMAYEWFWGHILVDWPHILLALSFAILLVKQSSSGIIRK